MTEKICPLMSRPLQGPNSCFENEDDMIAAKWYPVDGIAWENVFLCQRENCMAWDIDNSDRECNADFECTKYERSGYDDNTCNGCEHSLNAVGYCKLIEKRD